MAEGHDVKRYPFIRVNKEAMASLVGRYMQNSDFRTAVRNAKDDRSLRDVLDEAGYGVPSELKEKELEAVLDFHRHTVRQGWSDERIYEELIGSPVDDDITHLRG